MARPKKEQTDNQHAAAVADFQEQVVTNPEPADTGEVNPDQTGEPANIGASVPADTFDYRAAYEAEKVKTGDLQTLIAEITANSKNEIEKLQTENKRLQEAVSAVKKPKDTRMPYQILFDQLSQAENTAGEIVKAQIAAGGPIIRMRRIQGEIHKLIKEAKVYV
jgi:hypothetical protein